MPQNDGGREMAERTESITEVVAQHLTNHIEQSRDAVRQGVRFLQVIKAERVYVNGVRSQVETMIGKLSSLDDDYVKLLRLTHEHYGTSEKKGDPGD